MKKKWWKKLWARKTFWSRKKTVKIRKRQKITRFSKLLSWFYKRHTLLITLTVIAFVVFLLSLGLKKTFLAPRYSIQEIRYDPQSVATYDDPLIYAALKAQLLDKNFFSIKRFNTTRILSTIQQDYPLVESLDIRMQDDQIAFVSLSFNKPVLVFQLPENRRYASFEETLYPLGTGDALWNDSLTIELPRYSAELPNINGIFYRISEQRLYELVSRVIDTLWSDNIVERIYLPWWEKLFISYKAKRLYFHLNKDITAQLEKLTDIENNYALFESLALIDLGSNDDVIVR